MSGARIKEEQEDRDAITALIQSMYSTVSSQTALTQGNRHEAMDFHKKNIELSEKNNTLEDIDLSLLIHSNALIIFPSLTAPYTRQDIENALFFKDKILVLLKKHANLKLTHFTKSTLTDTLFYFAVFLFRAEQYPEATEVCEAGRQLLPEDSDLSFFAPFQYLSHMTQWKITHSEQFLIVGNRIDLSIPESTDTTSDADRQNQERLLLCLNLKSTLNQTTITHDLTHLQQAGDNYFRYRNYRQAVIPFKTIAVRMENKETAQDIKPLIVIYSHIVICLYNNAETAELESYAEKILGLLKNLDASFRNEDRMFVVAALAYYAFFLFLREQDDKSQLICTQSLDLTEGLPALINQAPIYYLIALCLWRKSHESESNEERIDAIQTFMDAQSISLDTPHSTYSVAQAKIANAHLNEGLRLEAVQLKSSFLIFLLRDANYFLNNKNPLPECYQPFFVEFLKYISAELGKDKNYSGEDEYQNLAAYIQSVINAKEEFMLLLIRSAKTKIATKSTPRSERIRLEEWHKKNTLAGFPEVLYQYVTNKTDETNTMFQAFYETLQASAKEKDDAAEGLLGSDELKTRLENNARKERAEKEKEKQKERSKDKEITEEEKKEEPTPPPASKHPVSQHPKPPSVKEIMLRKREERKAAERNRKRAPATSATRATQPDNPVVSSATPMVSADHQPDTQTNLASKAGTTETPENKNIKTRSFKASPDLHLIFQTLEKKLGNNSLFLVDAYIISDAKKELHLKTYGKAKNIITILQSDPAISEKYRIETFQISGKKNLGVRLTLKSNHFFIEITTNPKLRTQFSPVDRVIADYANSVDFTLAGLVVIRDKNSRFLYNLYDGTGKGFDDLDNKIIRAVTPPKTLTQAATLFNKAAQLNFKIAKETIDDIKKLLPELDNAGEARKHFESEINNTQDFFYFLTVYLIFTNKSFDIPRLKQAIENNLVYANYFYTVRDASFEEQFKLNVEKYQKAWRPHIARILSAAGAAGAPVLPPHQMQIAFFQQQALALQRQQAEQARQVQQQQHMSAEATASGTVFR